MRLKVGYLVVAFIGYELIAYFVNRSVWQRATATGDYSGQMPFDFLGQLIGYGPSMASPPLTESTAPTLRLPAPPLPLFRPAPIPAPNPAMPPDILANGTTPPFITWPSGA